ncbi:hypothetical protein RKE29_28760, partial [Streptomyces sp. B1866]|nr:hypothetical protein [Streptomyces sp. B1866]
MQRQVPHDRAAHLLTCAQGQLDKGGTGKQDRAQDGVIGQPGVGAQRQPPGEDDLVVARDADDGAQQRVPGVGESDLGRLGGAGGGVHPVVLVLEGVGGQVDGPGFGEQRRPVDRMPLDMHRAQRRHRGPYVVM